MSSVKSVFKYFSNFAILTAPVNVAISKISSGINVITLIPYVVRVLFGPLHRWMFRPSVMSKFRGPFNFFEGIGIGIIKFGWQKRLCINIKTYLVSEKKSQYRYVLETSIWKNFQSQYQQISSRNIFSEMLLVVSKNLVSKKARYWYWIIWSQIKSSVLGIGKFALKSLVLIIEYN